MSHSDNSNIEPGYGETTPPPRAASGAGDLTPEEQDKVQCISKDVISRTDELLQEKVDRMLTAAAGDIQKHNRQQDQLHSSMEAELKICRDRVKTLEAEKEQMQKSIAMLQEQLTALAAQLNYRNFANGWAAANPMAMGGPASAGMMGQFATLPGGFPRVPTLPAERPPSEVGEVSQPSTTAPPSPLATPHLSQPPTPQRELAPLPPPGLPPPPGLGAPETSAPISLAAAIDSTNAQKPKTASADQAHEQALQKMMACGSSQERKDSTHDAEDERPPPVSPGARGTPSRNRSELLSSPCATLNLTPKRNSRIAGMKSPGGPGMRSPGVPPSPFVICESGGSVFGFTIRKADDCSLGLDVHHTDTEHYLQVTGIKPNGAIYAWNKQCVGGPAAGKAVMPGDKVVKVNEATTPLEMLNECREKKLLRFTVQRGNVDDDFDPTSLGSWGVKR